MPRFLNQLITVAVWHHWVLFLQCWWHRYLCRHIYKKGTEKVVLWEVKGLIQVIVKFRTEICICFYHWTSFLGTWNFNSENICAQERLISFSYTIWFMISEKKIYYHAQVSSPWRMHTLQKYQRGIQFFFFSALNYFYMDQWFLLIWTHTYRRRREF